MLTRLVASWKDLTRRKSVRERVARRHLRGDGIEIGALAAPLAVPRGARVRYVDNADASAAAAHYGEQKKVVVPDLITDGFTLPIFGDRALDFVIANHVLEHAPEAVSVLENWLRVLRPGGLLYAAVPMAEGCFDRGRPITRLDHFFDDHRAAPDVLEQRNLAHYREWLEFSEVTIARERGEEPPPGDREARARHLATHHADIHFHTFSPESYEVLLRHVVDGRGSIVDFEVTPDGFEAIAIVRAA